MWSGADVPEYAEYTTPLFYWIGNHTESNVRVCVASRWPEKISSWMSRGARAPVHHNANVHSDTGISAADGTGPQRVNGSVCQTRCLSTRFWVLTCLFIVALFLESNTMTSFRLLLFFIEVLHQNTQQLGQVGSLTGSKAIRSGRVLGQKSWPSSISDLCNMRSCTFGHYADNHYIT